MKSQSLKQRIEVHLAENAIGWTEFASLVGYSTQHVRTMRHNGFDHCSDAAIARIEKVLQSSEQSATPAKAQLCRPKKSAAETSDTVVDSAFMQDVKRLDPDMDIMHVVRLLTKVKRKKNMTLWQFMALCIGALDCQRAGLSIENMLGRNSTHNPNTRKPKRASKK